MKKEAKIEQTLAWFRLLFAIASTIDASLFAWLFTHRKVLFTNPSLDILFVCCLSSIFLFFVVFFGFLIFKLLRRM